MANQKTYTIEIQGINESYEGVKKLVDVLNQLGDKNAKVVTTTDDVTTAETKQSSAIETSTKAVKEKASANDALSKAQQKLADYDAAYEQELARTKAELSANQKEIKNLIKIQEAQATVEAKQLDTYKEKQDYLSALNTLIRNHSTETEEDRAAIAAMVEESANLQAELKEIDAEMEIFTRNVGNYPNAMGAATESQRNLKAEIKDLKAEMAEMLVNGVSKTDEAYQALAERAGMLKDALGDVSDDIAHFASDTSGMDNVINLAQSGVSAFQLYSSAMTLFGDENEEASETMKTLMATMSALQALQTMQNTLLANGTATGKLYTSMVNGLKSMLGLKTQAVQADTTSQEANIAATETSMSATQSETVVEQENAAAKDASAAASQMAASAAEAEAAAKTSAAASEGAATSATMSNTTATQSNTTAKTGNATATKTLDTSTKALTTSENLNAAATNKMSVAQKAGAVASRVLGTAMKAIPLMAIIGLVTTLIEHWQEIWAWFKKTFPILGQLEKGFKKMGGVMNALKAVCKGVYEAIKNWIINPFKTMAEVIGKILKGDFSGAIEAAKQGLVNQFKGTGEAFANAFNESLESGIEKNKASEKMKQTQRELEDMEDKGQAKGKAYHDKKMEYLDQEAKAAQGNEEKLREIERERNQEETRYREENERASQKAHSEAQKRAKERDATAKKAHSDRMKEQKERDAAAKKSDEERKKALEEYQKMIDDLLKKSEQLATNSTKKINDNYRQALQTQEKWLADAVTSFISAAQEQAVTGTQEAIDKMLELADLFNNRRKGIQLTLFGEDLKAVKKELQDMIFDIAQTREKIESELFNFLPIKDQPQYEEFIALLREWGKTTDQIKKADLQSQWEQLQKVMLLASRNEEFDVLNRLQEDYEKTTDVVKKGELAKQIEVQENKIFKAVGDNRQKLYEQWIDLTKQERALEESAVDRIGKWFYNDIEVPIDFNYDAAMKRAEKAYDEIAKMLLDKAKKDGISVYELFLDWQERPSGFDEGLLDIMDEFDQGLNVNTTKILKKLSATIEKNLDFSTIFDTIIGGANDLTKQLNDQFRQMPDSLGKFLIILKTVGATEEDILKITEMWGDTEKYYAGDLGAVLEEMIHRGKFYIDYAGTEGRKAYETLKKLNDDYLKQTYDALKKTIDEEIKITEEGIKTMEKQYKDHPLQPIKREDMFSGSIAGDVIDKGKTIENYKKALTAAKLYYDEVKEGGKLRVQWEEAWQKKVETTQKVYGLGSKEALDMEDAARKAYEKMDEEAVKAYNDIIAAQEKLRDADDEYYDNLSKRMKKVFDVFQDNVIDPISDAFNALFEFELDEMNEYLDRLSELLDEATDLRQESVNRIDEINSQLRDSDSQNLDALKQRLADEEVLLAERQAMERKLQLEKEDQEKRIQAKEKQQKKAQLLQSMFEGIANTAVGVTAALKYGPILGPIFAAIVGAMGTAQVGIIAAQINKLKDGGLLEGPSHSQGGMRIEGTNIEVEGQEFVVNKRSTKKYLPLLEAINADKSGSGKSFRPMSKFANGGRLNVERASRAAEYGMSAYAFDKAISKINMRPQVAVVDINEAQQALTQVEVLAGRSA